MVDKIYSLFGQCFFYKKNKSIIPEAELVSNDESFSNREKILKAICNMGYNAAQIEQLQLLS
jgi:hypothetical protein